MFEHLSDRDLRLIYYALDFLIANNNDEEMEYIAKFVFNEWNVLAKQVKESDNALQDLMSRINTESERRNPKEVR